MSIAQNIYNIYFVLRSENSEIRLDRIRFDVCSCCWQRHQQQNMFLAGLYFCDFFLLLRLVVSSFRDVINIFLFIEFFPCARLFDDLAYVLGYDNAQRDVQRNLIKNH